MRKLPRVPIGAAIRVSPGSNRSCSSAASEQLRKAARGPRLFNVQFLKCYDNVDRDTLKLRAGPGASYEVDIPGAQCAQIDWAHRVAIESTPVAPSLGRFGPAAFHCRALLMLDATLL